MIALLFGAVGAAAVIALVTFGICVGWTIRGRCGKSSAAEETREEQRLVREEQRAFEDMLHYNMDTAYGMNGDIGSMMGGDGE